MRTGIVIDDALMKQAMQAGGARSKREAVELGLRTVPWPAARGGGSGRSETRRGSAGQTCGGGGVALIVVDSSVWIDFFNGVSTAEVERLDGLLELTPIAIGDLILVEVVQGFRQDRD